MQFFLVKPEVAGGLGEGTIMDRNVHPPKIHSLHYVFDGWSGDVLLTSFPSFIVTEEARRELKRVSASGICFCDVQISKSETFEELFPDVELPTFHWMRVVGKAGVDDFGIAPNLRLVASERVLDVLRKLRLSEANVQPY